MAERVVTVCIQHRILGYLPWDHKWHLHISKPVVMMSSDDYRFINELQADLGKWWKVDYLAHDL